MDVNKEADPQMPVVDPAALDRLRRLGGNSLVKRMIDLFCSHADSKLEEARTSLGNRNLEAFGRAVHSLRSSASNVGATVVYNLSGKLEMLAAEKRASDLPSIFADMEEAYRQAKTRLLEVRGVSE